MAKLKKPDAVQASNNCLMELWDAMADMPGWVAEAYSMIDSATQKSCGKIYRPRGKSYWYVENSDGGRFATQQAALERAAFMHGVL